LPRGGSFHDYAVFTVIKDCHNSLEENDPYNSPEGYYPVNETIARHINGTKDCGHLFRICKYYFVHGSTNIRECENCGKMMLVFGEWEEKSKQLFSPPPFKTKLFERTPRTKEEGEAQRDGKYDAIHCSFCSTMTYAYNTKMIMQSAYKGGHASFLEEIQRDAKVSLSGAKHIILLGYSLPPDDVVWRSAIAKQKGENAYCSVVVGYKGKDKWIERDELKEYLEDHGDKKDKADYGVNTINAAIAIFGEDKVRAYSGGIPKVWCSDGNSVDKEKVKNLLYPSKIFPGGVANMRI
jgi:hypothetical protein